MSAAPDGRRYIWAPQPGPQTFALGLDPEVEIIFGGARGGGKSDTVVAMMLEHVLVYGRYANCVIFRVERVQFEDLLRRMMSLYVPLGAKYNGSKHFWTFPNGGRITLAHVANAKEAARYQGWQVNFLAFEELTNWPDYEPVRLLYGILRDPYGVPCRWIATANPGGVGHGWVKQEFIDGAEPFVPRPVRDDAGEVLLNDTGRPKLRCFIPSKVGDNPALFANDPNYVANLRRQNPYMADAWLTGDWDIAPGAILEHVWSRDRHVIPAMTPPHWWAKGWAFDWGWSKPYAAVFFAVRPSDGAVILFDEVYGCSDKYNVGLKHDPHEIARRIQVTLDRYPGRWRQGVCDVACWTELGRSRGVSIASELRDAGLRLRKGPAGGGSRRANEGATMRVVTLQLLMQRLADDAFFVTENCRHWLRTVPTLPPDDEYPDDIDTASEDHLIDATRYWLWAWDSKVRARAPKKPPKPVPRPQLAHLTSTGALRGETLSERLLRGDRA